MIRPEHRNASAGDVLAGLSGGRGRGPGHSRTGRGCLPWLALAVLIAAAFIYVRSQS